MSAYEERQALMAQAAALDEQLRLLRIEFSKITDPIRQLSARLVSEGDGLMLKAADEKDAGQVVVKREVRVDFDGYKPSDVPAPSGTRKRMCGLCHSDQPHPHRAKNCPNAHLVREQDKAVKEATGGKKQRKQRKPMSPERKAQLIETLKKSRAARWKK